jgi:hypothetical protein
LAANQPQQNTIATKISLRQILKTASARIIWGFEKVYAEKDHNANNPQTITSRPRTLSNCPAAMFKKLGMRCA